MSTRISSEDATRLGDGQPVDDETPDAVGAFPRLTDAQVATLETGGTRRSVHAGEVLIRAGTRSSDFFVILSGKVAIIDEGAEDGERRILRLHGPGRFLGELGLLEDQVAFFTAEAIARVTRSRREAAAARLSAAATEIDKARSGHQPTLDVVADWSRSHCSSGGAPGAAR